MYVCVGGGRGLWVEDGVKEEFSVSEKHKSNLILPAPSFKHN